MVEKSYRPESPPTPAPRGLACDAAPANSSVLVKSDPGEVCSAVQYCASAKGNHASAAAAQTALAFLRKPLGLLIVICLLSIPFSLVALSPLCWVPGILPTHICTSSANRAKAPQWVDYPRLVEIQSLRFSVLLEEGIGSSGTSLGIKRAEVAVRALISLVRASDLKGKETLAEHLSKFASDAKETGKGLSRVSSRIAGAVDNIIAVNDYALLSIEGHKAKSNSGALAIIWPFLSQTSVEEVLRATFINAMSVIETQIRRVVLEAEVSLRNLELLEGQLYTISDLVAKENKMTIDDLDALRTGLAGLWSILGGNKKELRQANENLSLLSNVDRYREQASEHVSAALKILEGMSEDMEDLRERVAAPELVGDEIPMEVHLASIKYGLARLQSRQEQTKQQQEVTERRITGKDE